MELIKSNVGKHVKFHYNGYQYIFNKSNKDTDYYFCSEWVICDFFSLLTTIWWKYRCFRYIKEAKCKGRLIHYKNVDKYKETGHHLHAPDTRDKKKNKLLNVLKEAAKNDHRKSREIVGEISSLANASIKPVLPSATQMMRTVQRMRAKGKCPKNPSSLEELDFPDDYTKTLDGQDFLIFDSGPGEERILIFSTEENLNLLASCSSIYMDGTFGVAPLLFTQLYTIHGKFRLLSVSIAFLLESYSHLFPIIFPGFNCLCFIFRQNRWYPRAVSIRSCVQ